jgi:hypothetical protein
MHQYYWPPTAPRKYTLEAYEQAFATEGFIKCSNDSYDVRVTRVVVFAIGNWPTHAARQLSINEWTSKLGQSHDITHELQGVTGKEYGNPLLFLCRKEP